MDPRVPEELTQFRLLVLNEPVGSEATFRTQLVLAFRALPLVVRAEALGSLALLLHGRTVVDGPWIGVADDRTARGLGEESGMWLERHRRTANPDHLVRAAETHIRGRLLRRLQQR